MLMQIKLIANNTENLPLTKKMLISKKKMLSYDKVEFVYAVYRLIRAKIKLQSGDTKKIKLNCGCSH